MFIMQMVYWEEKDINRTRHAWAVSLWNQNTNSSLGLRPLLQRSVRKKPCPLKIWHRNASTSSYRWSSHMPRLEISLLVKFPLTLCSQLAAQMFLISSRSILLVFSKLFLARSRTGVILYLWSNKDNKLPVVQQSSCFSLPEHPLIPVF